MRQNMRDDGGLEAQVDDIAGERHMTYYMRRNANFELERDLRSVEGDLLPNNGDYAHRRAPCCRPNSWHSALARHRPANRGIEAVGC